MCVFDFIMHMAVVAIFVQKYTTMTQTVQDRYFTNHSKGLRLTLPP